MGEVGPRTDQYSTSGQLESRRVTKNLQQRPDQTAPSGVTGNDDALGVYRPVRSTRWRANEVEICGETVLNRAWKWVLWRLYSMSAHMKPTTTYSCS